MTITRVGTNDKYAKGWGMAFGAPADNKPDQEAQAPDKKTAKKLANKKSDKAAAKAKSKK